MRVYFSVIIPTLNEEKFLPRLLESLSLQTFHQFEVLVIDGGSKDNTCSVARSYKKKFSSLHVITSDTLGVSYQRNLGARKAQGEWLLFIDADTILFPTTLARAFQYIEVHNSAGIITSWFLSDGNMLYDVGALGASFISLEMNNIWHHPWAPGAFTIMDKQSFAAVHGYDEKIRLGEDHDISIRSIKQGIPYSIIRTPLFRYSSRRFRKFGLVKTTQTYLEGNYAIVSGQKGKNVTSFESGGHMYDR